MITHLDHGHRLVILNQLRLCIITAHSSKHGKSNKKQREPLHPRAMTMSEKWLLANRQTPVIGPWLVSMVFFDNHEVYENEHLDG